MSPTDTTLRPAQERQVRIDEETLRSYARAYVRISEARDQAHDELAESRNKTQEAQQEIRDELQQRIGEILEEQGLTRERYREITLMVSADPEHQEAFQQVLETLDADAPTDGEGALR